MTIFSIYNSLGADRMIRGGGLLFFLQNTIACSAKSDEKNSLFSKL